MTTMSRATIALLFLATAVTASPGRHKTSPGRLKTSLAQHPQRRLPSSQYTRLVALRGGTPSITPPFGPI